MYADIYKIILYYFSPYPMLRHRAVCKHWNNILLEYTKLRMEDLCIIGAGKHKNAFFSCANNELDQVNDISLANHNTFEAILNEEISEPYVGYYNSVDFIFSYRFTKLNITVKCKCYIKREVYDALLKEKLKNYITEEINIDVTPSIIMKLFTIKELIMSVFSFNITVINNNNNFIHSHIAEFVYEKSIVCCNNDNIFDFIKMRDLYISMVHLPMKHLFNYTFPLQIRRKTPDKSISDTLNIISKVWQPLQPN